MAIYASAQRSRLVKRILGIGFWVLIAAPFAWYFYIGGVVIETKVEGSQHLIMMRENRGVWLPVSKATYLAHFAIKYSMFAVCMSFAAWAAWRWMWHGNLKN